MPISLTMFADRRVRIPLAAGALMACGAVVRLAAVNIAILNAGFFTPPAADSALATVSSPLSGSPAESVVPTVFFGDDAATGEERALSSLARHPSEAAPVSRTIFDVTQPARVQIRPARLEAGTVSLSGEVAEWRLDQPVALPEPGQAEFGYEWLTPCTAG